MSHALKRILKPVALMAAGLFVVLLALVFMADRSPGHAASLDNKKPATSPLYNDNLPSMAPAKSWTGCWIGAHVGYLVQTEHQKDSVGAWTFDVTQAADGFLYGLGAGCDLQRGNVVVGVQGDYSFTNADNQITFRPVGFLAPTVVGDIDVKRMWFAGGTLGYLITPHVKPYVLIGYTAVTSDTFLNAGVAGDRGGLTLGAGIEAMVDSGWSAKLEYRFVDLGSDTIKWGSHVDSIADVDRNLHQVRLGFAYKFGVFDRAAPAK